MNVSLRNIIPLLGVLILLSSFNTEKKFREIVIVKNKLPFERIEVVSIPLNAHKSLFEIKDFSTLFVKDAKGKLMVTQLIDTNLDGSWDELLFQACVPAKATAGYTLFTATSLQAPKAVSSTYARFVPERIDDFAWENDRVAFRTYGPEAQRLVEEGKSGGTLSSGIDLWLKKVNYPIIDSWYSKNEQAPGYYHIEHGEGYDPYHVGSSRGSGGTGIWEKDSLHISKNYSKYRVIANGPLRSLFELDYAVWSKYSLRETKRISIDLGSNFSKFENTINSDKAIPNYTLGITLHQQKGSVSINAKKAIFRHWEPIDNTFVGEGIVIDPKVVQSAIDHRSKVADQSQILVVTAPKNNVVTYYVGFAWTGSKQVHAVQDWDAILERQSQIVQNPLVVTFK